MFYKRRSKYGGINASLMTHMKELEDENRRIKKVYAEERLKAEIIQKALTKKEVKPSCQREMAQQSVEHKGVSIRLACMTFGINQTCDRYQSKYAQKNVEIADHLIRLIHSAIGDCAFCICVTSKTKDGITNRYIAFTVSLH